MQELKDYTILQAMFVEATIGIVMVNAEGLIIRINPIAEKLFGYNKGALISEPVEILVPDAAQGIHASHRQKYNLNPKPRLMGEGMELFGKRKDGTEFPLEISLSHVMVEKEQFVIAYVNDISERKQNLKELQTSKEQLSEAQSIAHVGHFNWNTQTGEINWSDEHYRIFGLEPQSMLMTYDKFLEYVIPEDIPRIKDITKTLYKGEDYSRIEYAIKRPDQTTRFLLGTVKVVKDTNDKIIQIIGTTQDVTEKVIKDQELVIRNEAIKSSVAPIVFGDLEGNITYANQAFLELWGFSNENEVVGVSNMELGNSPDKVREIMEALLSKGHWSGEDTAKKKDGTPFEIFLSTSLVKNENDTPICTIATLIDITELKKTQKKLENQAHLLDQKVKERTKELAENQAKLNMALKKERDLSELKSRFVSMASHEFRTPLSSILSSSDLIEIYYKKKQYDKQLKHISRIRSSVNNLTMILNDFLSLEKLESGKISFSPEPVDFPEYAEEILGEISVLLGPGQEIHHKHSGPFEVLIDLNLVKNVLLNLLSNAIKYSTRGEDIELISENKGDKLEIQVRDHGIGIPEAEQKHMFTRFFRASNVTAIKGTGLGLTIVRRYLDIMEGDVSFISLPNKGTTFTIVIPLTNKK